MDKARVDVLREAFHEQALPSSWVPWVHMPCLVDKKCSKVAVLPYASHQVDLP